MYIFLGIVAVLLLIGIVFFTRKNTNSDINIYELYTDLLEAATSYREKTGHYAKSLKPLLEIDGKYDERKLSNFELSLDGKFLVVKALPKEESERLINEIGGSSYINGESTYLTFVRKNDLSAVIPVAHFTIKPDGKITTTTPITYETSGCVAEGGEILEKKWENRKAVFTESGSYQVSLKIKDKNGNWSDTYVKEIKVTEEAGLRDLEVYNSSHFLIYNCGRVLCFGKNEDGQLGIGSLNAVPDWQYFSLHDGIMQIAPGDGFNIFRMYDGTVLAAGSNRHGELATGDKSPQKSLNAIWGLENIKQISTGKSFGAALDYLGNVYVWGNNDSDQLMDPEVSDAVSPQKLKKIEGVKQISCGENFGLALKYDGTVVGWGDNSFGQLALGYKGSITEPSITLFKNAVSVHAGDRFSLVVTESGRVYGAGSNNYAQLGIKGKSEVLFPEEVVGIKEVASVKTKESLTIAVTKMGKAYVWGNFNTPAQKPVSAPTELSGISYIKVFANNGKKLFVVDGGDTLYTVSDLSGKYEQSRIYSNYHEFMESNNA